MISMLEDARNIARRGGWIVGGKPPTPPKPIADRSRELYSMIKLGIDTKAQMKRTMSEREIERGLDVLLQHGVITRSRRSGYLIYVCK